MSNSVCSSVQRACAAIVAMLAFGAHAAEVNNEIASATAGVTAVWKAQVVELSFATFDVAYSCASLQSKIASILRPVVAQRTTKIGIRCSSLGMGTSANATILVVSPVEATGENLHAMTNFSAHTQLVARVRSIDLPAEEDIPRFDARWQQVSLSRGRGLNLSSADCDLVRSIRDQVLPHLAVKVTRTSNMCQGRVPLLEVEALLPVADPALAKVTN
jgi:hypothetical protein